MFAGIFPVSSFSNVSHETQIVVEQTVHSEENNLTTVQVWHIQIFLIWKATKQLVYSLLRVFGHLPFMDIFNCSGNMPVFNI